MKYVLPSRDLIADSIELVVEAYRFDGLVLIASCDKIIPGMLMAAARLNLPAIMVTGGPMLPGRFENSDNLTLSDLRTFIGAVVSNRMSREELEEVGKATCPGVGSCSMMGTANTMSVITEALGMSLPTCATVHAVDKRKYLLAKESGRTIVRLVREGVNARDIMNREAFENAIRVLVALGRSLNAVMHLIAIANEAGIELSFSDFDELSRDTVDSCNKTSWTLHVKGFR